MVFRCKCDGADIFHADVLKFGIFDTHGIYVFYFTC